MSTLTGGPCLDNIQKTCTILRTLFVGVVRGSEQAEPIMAYTVRALGAWHPLAQELSRPYGLGLTLVFTACMHQHRGEVQAVRERAEAEISLCREYGFASWQMMGTHLRGWALAMQGQTEEEIAQMHQSLTAWRAMGLEVFRPYFLALLAEAYGKAGRTEAGLTVLTEALDHVDKTGALVYEAELHRLKGELLLSAKCEVRSVVR